MQAAKLLEKFRKKSSGNNAERSNGSPVQNGLGKKPNNETCPTRGLKDIRPDDVENRSPEVCCECSNEPKLPTSLPTLGLHVNEDADLELEKYGAAEIEGVVEQQAGPKSLSKSGDNLSGSYGSSSSKGDSESSSMVDCDIRWEDLKLGEEIVQGNHDTIIYDYESEMLLVIGLCFDLHW